MSNERRCPECGARWISPNHTRCEGCGHVRKDESEAIFQDAMREMFPDEKLYGARCPLHNVWLGHSYSTQPDLGATIKYLLTTPARVRFVSLEPLLGPIDLTQIDNGGGERFDALRNTITTHRGHTFEVSNTSPLSWVIAGCESGPRRRPAKIDWFRSLRDQCVAAGVPFYLKQMEINGKVIPYPELDGRRWEEFPG